MSVISFNKKIEANVTFHDEIEKDDVLIRINVITDGDKAFTYDDDCVYFTFRLVTELYIDGQYRKELSDYEYTIEDDDRLNLSKFINRRELSNELLDKTDEFIDELLSENVISVFSYIITND